jgi:hypothetical protein
MRRFVLAAIILTILALMASFSVVCGEVSVGVKSGDWITYNVNVTGNPPGDHNIQWASMNVTDVEGSQISLDIQTLFANGTLCPEHLILDLATGYLGDDFFIPPNLNVGNQFFDHYQGNITITAIEQQTVAGAQRTVMLGHTNYTNYVWDRETGTLVAATSIEPDYTMITHTNQTNIWQPDAPVQQEILGFEVITFYAVMVAIAAVIVALAVLSVIWIRQRKTRPLQLTLEVVGAFFTVVFLAAYLGGMFMTPSTTVLHSEPAFRIALFVSGAAFLVLILTNAIAAALQYKMHLNRYSAIKIGLAIVAASYFLFNLHALFTLEWIGEWNRVGGGFSMAVFIQDITNFVGIIIRFIGGVIAFGAVVFYFKKGLPLQQRLYRILRWILMLEAFYWFSLLPMAGINVYFNATTYMDPLSYFAWTTLPTLVEAIAPPIAQLILASKLKPSKPDRWPIKWALITGALYIWVFWLTNMGSWMQTVSVKGTGYLTSYPQNLLSFILTVGGLLALALYATYFAKKNSFTPTWEEFPLRGAGAIITLLGLYFLWNYVSWIFFGGNYIWSDWYAWFLGHNLDLWMLALPLLGIPLLFASTHKDSSSFN